MTSKRQTAACIRFAFLAKKHVCTTLHWGLRGCFRWLAILMCMTLRHCSCPLLLQVNAMQAKQNLAMHECRQVLRHVTYACYATTITALQLQAGNCCTGCLSVCCTAAVVATWCSRASQSLSAWQHPQPCRHMQRVLRCTVPAAALHHSVLGSQQPLRGTHT